MWCVSNVIYSTIVAFKVYSMRKISCRYFVLKQLSLEDWGLWSIVDCFLPSARIYCIIKVKLLCCVILWWYNTDIMLLQVSLWTLHWRGCHVSGTWVTCVRDTCGDCCCVEARVSPWLYWSPLLLVVGLLSWGLLCYAGGAPAASQHHPPPPATSGYTGYLISSALNCRTENIKTVWNLNSVLWPLKHCFIFITFQC